MKIPFHAKIRKQGVIFIFLLCCLVSLDAGEFTAWNSFRVELPPPAFPKEILLESAFGINTDFHPNTPNLEARIKAMQMAGIKWGRQDFTWSRIEREPGKYEWEPYDRLVDLCRQHGLQIFGDLAYAPKFHDSRTPEGVEAYAAFARAAAQRFAGIVDYPSLWHLGVEAG